MSEASWNKDLVRVIRKAWEDVTFRRRLVENPHKVLRENGFDIADDINVEFVKNTASTLYIPLPAPTPGATLSAAQLEEMKQGKPVFNVLRPVERSFAQEPLRGIADQLNASRDDLP